MKIRLEAATCDGFGTCAEHSPELFEVDEWGYASVRGDGDVPPELEGKVARAIADCPVHAIKTVTG